MANIPIRPGIVMPASYRRDIFDLEEPIVAKSSETGKPAFIRHTWYVVDCFECSGRYYAYLPPKHIRDLVKAYGRDDVPKDRWRLIEWRLERLGWLDVSSDASYFGVWVCPTCRQKYESDGA